MTQFFWNILRPLADSNRHRIARLLCLLTLCVMVWPSQAAEPIPIEPFEPGADFSPDTVPVSALLKKHRGNDLKTYAEWKGPKALAMALDGGWFSMYRFNEGSRRPPAEIMRMALEQCEWLTRRACAAYASGDKVAAGMGTLPLRAHASVVRAVGAFEPQQVPFMSSQATASMAKKMKEDTAPFKALVVSTATGNLALTTTRVSAASAVTSALKACTDNTSNVRCLVYAVNDEVVLGKSNDASAVSGAPTTPQKIQLLLMAAPGSEAQQKWEADMGKALANMPWLSSIEITRVLTKDAESVASDEYIPDAFKWITARIQSAKPGLTRAILMVDGVPVLDAADFSSYYLPLIESLALRKQK